MTQNVTLEDLKELETYLWVKGQLTRLESFVRRSKGGTEFTALIKLLKQDNEQWCNQRLLHMTGR